jgi:hypothetical protein
MFANESFKDTIEPLHSAAVAVVDEQLSPPPRALIVSANAVIVVDLVGEGESISLTLKEGLLYPIRIRKLVSTTAGAVTVLW